MLRNPETANGMLNQVRALLDAGQAREALELVERVRAPSAPLRNARGVCLMRLGEFDKAVEAYREFMLLDGGVCMRSDLPPVCKTNFATALLLTGNLPGCLATLSEVEDQQDAQVMKIRAALADWKRRLSWWRRLLYAVDALPATQRVTLPFPPGDV
ncbi:MAG TPA: hypothetical protein PKK06_08875 [Phycisphaerae bacterium]|nr:hypothetical protein [Phycisphaerae bacterium]HNU45316.1 hypothetical protein [Phycisphaerae bacterium]